MGIIHVPEQPEPPQRPLPNAADWPDGTIWESDDETQWMVVWDEQDHRKMWEQIRVKKTS